MYVNLPIFSTKQAIHRMYGPFTQRLADVYSVVSSAWVDPGSLPKLVYRKAQGQGACAISSLMMVTGLDQPAIEAVCAPGSRDSGLPFPKGSARALTRLGFSWRLSHGSDDWRERRSILLVLDPCHALVWCPETQRVFDPTYGILTWDQASKAYDREQGLKPDASALTVFGRWR